MTRKQRWEEARSQLSDPHGVWCAWCLDYIQPTADRDRDTLQRHHVLGYKDKIRQQFGFEPWTVPAHSDECHLIRLQPHAFAAGYHLLNTRDDIERRCKESFDRGCHSVSMLMSYRAWIDSRNPESRHAEQHLLNALRAACGSKLGLSLVAEVKGAPDFHRIESNPKYRLLIGNVHQNAGNLATAITAYDELEPELPRWRSAENRAKFARMKAFVEPKLDTARMALALSRDSPDPTYHERTAKIALAYYYEYENPFEAHTLAGEIGEGFLQNDPAWPHRIGQMFLWGRTALSSAGTRPSRGNVVAALRELIRVQYAAAFLGYVGNPVPNSASSQPTICTPTDIVHRVCDRHPISREKLIKIRRCAIFGRATPMLHGDEGSFQQRVLNSLFVGILPPASTSL